MVDSALQALERILYACESGSRAWGFASRDSDYDVRFVYVRPQDWYLSYDVELRRDVIEQPISDQLDINGWDLRKALTLLRKSNPPLLEWLSSPTVYWDAYGAADALRGWIADAYSPVACLFHYLHMARGNYRDYLQGEEVRIKKYFYVLRPLLAVKWIEAGLGVVPMRFATLVETLVTEPALRHEIDVLLARKIAGDELNYGPRNPVISGFIASELARLETVKPPLPTSKPPSEALNQLFRQFITAAWRV